MASVAKFISNEMFPRLVSWGPTDPRRGGWPFSRSSRLAFYVIHGAEHSLVLNLFGHWLAGTPAELYFAFPAEKVVQLAAAARPYTFGGHVAGYEDLGPLAGDPSRHKVRVRFDQLQ